MNRFLIYTLTIVVLVFANNTLAVECSVNDKIEYAKMGMSASQIKEICEARKASNDENLIKKDSKVIINNINTNNSSNNNSLSANNSQTENQRKSMEQFYWNISLGMTSSNDAKLGDFEGNTIIGLWYFFNQPYDYSLVIGASIQYFSVDDSEVIREIGEAYDSPIVRNSYWYLGYNFPNALGTVSIIPFYGLGSGKYEQTFFSLSSCFSCTGEVIIDYNYSVLGVRFFDVQNASHGSTWYVEFQHSTLSYDEVTATVREGFNSASATMDANNQTSDDDVTSINLGFTW